MHIYIWTKRENKRQNLNAGVYKDCPQENFQKKRATKTLEEEVHYKTHPLNLRKAKWNKSFKFPTFNLQIRLHVLKNPLALFLDAPQDMSRGYSLLQTGGRCLVINLGYSLLQTGERCLLINFPSRLPKNSLTVIALTHTIPI